MPSNVLLLALETLTQGGEILLLSLETFSVQSYGMMAVSKELQEDRAETVLDCQDESSMSKSAMTQTLHGTSGAQGKFYQDT